MIRLRAYKYKLTPNVEQFTKFEQHFRHARFVKNWAIVLKGRYYHRYGKGLSSRRLQNQLVKNKKQPECQWLNQINSQSLLAALKDVGTAFIIFFSGLGYFKLKKEYAA